MSQHDFSIANAGGATVRADINNVLAALQSNNSGSSAPTSATAGMFWLDTSGDPYVLKVRDKGNNHWLTLANITDPGSDGNIETSATIKGTIDSSATLPAGMARNVYFGSTDTEVAWSSGATTAVSVACATGTGSGDDCKFLIQGVVRLQTSSGTGIEVSIHRNSDGEIWNVGTSVWDASSNPNGVAFPVQYLDETAGLIGTVTYYVKIERISGSGAVAINYDDGVHDQKSSISVTEFKK